jgi:SWI/SNF-related matrix-associated actin-dependent regulator of chromatin subfamily A member 5
MLTLGLFVASSFSYHVTLPQYEMAKTAAMTRTWSRQHFNLLVLDEGHRIKALETQISKAVRKIHAETRVILTGTPLANNLVELYSLLSFLAPDVFSTFEEGFNLSLNIIDPKKLMQANRLLEIFMIRRLKVEVEKLMPLKIETQGGLSLVQYANLVVQGCIDEGYWHLGA